MKKIIAGILCLLLVVGCGCSITEDSPKEQVKLFLNRYNDNDSEVMDELETYVSEEDFTDDQKETYKEVLKKQYKDLKYNIEDETIDGDTATVTVKVTVYDLYKVQKDADEYLTNNPDKFKGKDNDDYDDESFINYKLEQMQDNTDTIDYTIVFNLTKTDDKWQVEQLSNDDLEKIHGVYNYEEE